MDNAAVPPETVLVPVTGLVRMSLPSKEERAELVASLEAASAEIKSGAFTVFEKAVFTDWMVEGYKNQKQQK